MLVWGVRFTAESLAEMLKRDPLITVVGLCTNLPEAMALSEALQPDIILLDARIPDGIAALRHGLDFAPGMRVVVSAVSETEHDVIAWAEAGAIGYIPRTTPLSDFVRLVQTIHSGEQECTGSVAAGLLRRIATSGARRWTPNGPPAFAGLTKRERQTAELIKSGLSDKEIARRLNITVATTKSHVHNLLNKLNLRRRSQIAGYFRDDVPLRSRRLVSLLILAIAVTGQWNRAEHTWPRFHTPQIELPKWFQSRRCPRFDLTRMHAMYTEAKSLLVETAKAQQPPIERRGRISDQHPRVG